MRSLVAVATAAVSIAFALGRADAATANLATDGFAFDGKTTYCEGVRDPKAPLIFEKELVASAGKCPIALEMTATLRNTANSNAVEVWVDWSASLESGDVAQSLFPRVVDATSGSPKPIIASLVRACKSGSNCATDADVVVPAAVQSDATTTGPFDDDNHKALRGFVFGFPSGQVDHIVIAKIVLPGDPQLNISATEFITLQHVQSSGDATVAPGTVKPYESQDRDANGSVGSEAAVLTFKPAKKSNSSDINVNATGTDNGLGASTPTTGKKTNIILLSAIGGLACVVAIAYFVAAKREKTGAPPLADDNDVNPSIYRLTDAAKQAASVRFSQAPHPPRRPLQRPWPAPPVHQPFVERSSEIVPPPFNQPRAVPSSHVDLTMSIDSSSDMLESQTTSLNSLNDSQAMSVVPSDMTSFNSLNDSQVSSFNSLHDSAASELSSFSGLHDSAVTLPVTSQQRHHRASSASMQLDELQDNLSYSEDASRLFNSTHLTAVLQHAGPTAHDDSRTTTQSSLAWRESELSDASDLEGLTMPIHERVHRL